MQLTILGCGDAFGSKGRFNTSFLLESDNEKILVDCGATTLVRLKQVGVAIDEIHTVVLTHFHGDHYGGVPFLILSRHFEYANKPLTIIGPKGLKDKLMTLQEALYPGTSEFYEELDVKLVEYAADEWTEVEGLTVLAKEVTHSPPSSPHGLHIRWKGKTFAYSGDTSWNDHLLDLANGSDLFIIESNNLHEKTTGHLCYQEVLEKKNLFKTKKLYLTHMSGKVIDQQKLEISRLEDGMVINF